jgi:hypothetical protein
MRSRRWRRCCARPCATGCTMRCPVVYGIEPHVILKDIWGLPDREVERTALWMADALIDAALREPGPTERRHGQAESPKRPVAKRAARRANAERASRGARPPQEARCPVIRPHGSTSSTTTGPAFPNIRRSSSTGPTPRRGRANATPTWSRGPTAARRASGSTSSRPPRPARRCSSTCTAATGAPWTSAARASWRRRSSTPAPWWCCPATSCVPP